MCSAELEDSALFCSACGINLTQNPEETPVIEPVVVNTENTSEEYSKADIELNKIMAILAYIGILVLIPIFAAKESKFARFHANQGLVLFIASVVYGIATSIVTGIFRAFSWQLATAMQSLFSLGSLVFLVLMILGIINAASGTAKELPITGKYTILK